MPLPLALSLLFTFAIAVADDLPWKRHTLKVDGEKREYFVYEPAKRKSGFTVVALHGGAGTASGFARQGKWIERADHYGFLLVMPSGWRRRWNDGRLVGEEHQDDLAFLRALKAEVVESYRANPHVFFLAGVSNGGMMALRVACEDTGLFRGYSAVIAHLGQNVAKRCRPKAATSVLHIFGDKDPLVPFRGGEVTGPLGLNKLGRVIGARDTDAQLTRLFGCQLEREDPEQNDLESDGTAIVRTHYACRDRTFYESVFVKGGGHTWPGGTQYLAERLVGKVSLEFSATDESIQFFRRVLAPPTAPTAAPGSM